MIRQYDPETLEKLQRAQVSMLKDVDEVCNNYEIPYYIAYGSLIGAMRHQGFIPWDDDTDLCMFRADYERFVGIFEEALGEKYRLVTPETTEGYSSAVIKIEKKGTIFVPEASRRMKHKMGIFLDVFILDKCPNDEAKLDAMVKKSRRMAQTMFLIGSPDPEIPNKGLVGAAMKAACVLIHYIFKLWPNARIHYYKKFHAHAVLAANEDTERYTAYQSLLIKRSIVNKSDIFPLRRAPFEDIMVNIPAKAEEILTNYYGDYMALPPEDKRVNHAAYEIDFGE